MKAANSKGQFQLQTTDIDHRDVSTVRRMLGGVHGAIVVSAWNNKSTIMKQLLSSRKITDAALAAAASK